MDPSPDIVPPFSVGGQAVLEGVMMRSPAAVATAVRRPDGQIAITSRPFRGVAAKYKFLNLPILRGGVNLVETIALGMQSLNWSADQAAGNGTRAAGTAPDWRQQLGTAAPSAAVGNLTPAAHVVTLE